MDASRLSLRDSRVTVQRVEGRFRTDTAPDFTAEQVALQARATGFDLENPTLHGGDLHLVVQDAVLPRAAALDALLSPESPLWIESGTARASADLTVSDSQRSAGGGVDLSLSNAAVHLEDMRFSGDFRFHAGLQGYRPEDDLLGLSDARLEMRNVNVTGASASTAGWHGDLTFTRAALRLQPEPQLDGVAVLDARDARPLLAVLFGSGFPRILVRATDVPRLVGSARISVGPDRLSIVDLSAGGGDIGLRGSYAAVGERRRGGVIARKWFLSVGVGINNDGTGLQFFGLDGWLRRQRAAAIQLLGSPAPR
jgi:hypothetical protein